MVLGGTVSFVFLRVLKTKTEDLRRSQAKHQNLRKTKLISVLWVCTLYIILLHGQLWAITEQ